VAKHGGRLVKATGGVLLEFPLVLEVKTAAKPIHHFLENLNFFNKNSRPYAFDRTGNE